MSKFNKFLEEDNLKIKKEENKKDDNRYSSLKIKINTLDTLRKIKTTTNEASYSALIEKMIDNYIATLPKKDRNNINILQ